MLPFEKEFPELGENLTTMSYFMLVEEAAFIRYAYFAQRPMSTPEYYSFLLGFEIGRLERDAKYAIKIGIYPLPHFIEMEKMAKGVGAKASYKRTLSILERLAKWGFLKKRPVQHMKEKFFWVLNPPFLQKYGSQLKAIEEKSPLVEKQKEAKT